VSEEEVLRNKIFRNMKLKLQVSGENSLRISYSLQKNQNDYIKKGKLCGTRCRRGIKNKGVPRQAKVAQRVRGR